MERKIQEWGKRLNDWMATDTAGLTLSVIFCVLMAAAALLGD